MRRIALTGGLAAGKSTVARLLAAHGYVIIDYDAVARMVMDVRFGGGLDGEAGALRAALRVAFGDEVVGLDGTIDRAALADVVFADPAARTMLEGLTHPLIRAQAQALEAEAKKNNASVVIHEIPLLVESGQGRAGFDGVITVSASQEVRVARAVATRAMTPDAAKARIQAQATDEMREQVADLVLQGGGTRRDLEEQVCNAVLPFLRRC